MLGRSGASIVDLGGSIVQKTGGVTDLSKQASLCQYLGTEVAPEILSIYQGRGYLMEKLYPLAPEIRDYEYLLGEIYVLLLRHVWGRTPQYWNGYWRLDLAGRLSTLNRFRLAGHLDELYSTDEVGTLIHGDCTIANLMTRANGDFVLIDPFPCRANVPSLRELDQATMMQSAAGWEHALDPDGWPQPDSERLFDLILAGYSEERIRRIYFWAAYKCVRILSHPIEECTVDHEGWRRTEEWAEHWLSYFMEKLS